jgi:hypothetical protein
MSKKIHEELPLLSGDILDTWHNVTAQASNLKALADIASNHGLPSSAISAAAKRTQAAADAIFNLWCDVKGN